MSPAPDLARLDRLALRVVERATSAGLTLAIAESLTGGSVAARIVDAPGASVVLRGAVVAYATDVKRSVLGVDGDLLAARGAVDAEVARQMAVGVRRLLGADLGVATTGVAGPAPQDGHPPGTLHLAAVGATGTLLRSVHLEGSRSAVRDGAVGLALELVIEIVATARRAERLRDGD